MNPTTKILLSQIPADKLESLLSLIKEELLNRTKIGITKIKKKHILINNIDSTVYDAKMICDIYSKYGPCDVKIIDNYSICIEYEDGRDRDDAFLGMKVDNILKLSKEK